MIVSQLTPSTKKLRVTTSVAFLYLASMLLPVVEAAEPEDYLYYRVKNVTFRPNFTLTETYNDNVYTRGDTPFTVVNPDGSFSTIKKIGDFITTVGGGAAISLGRPVAPDAIGNYLEFSYSYDHRFFHEQTVQNAGDHGAQLAAVFQRPRISASPSVQFSRTRSILTGSLQTPGLRDQLITRYFLSSLVPVRIELTPKSFATTRFSSSINKFEDGIPLLGSEQFGIQQSLGFQINERFSLGINGAYSRTSITSDARGLVPGPDQISYGGGFIAEGEISDRLTSRIQFGIRDVSFEGTSESFTPPVVTASLAYEFARDIFATVSYSRSTFVGFQSAGESGVSDVAGLTLSKLFGFQKEWEISATANLNSQKWEDSLTLPSGRSDTWLSAGLAITYQLRDWLSSSLSYGWQSYSSDQATVVGLGLVDYNVNTIALSLKLGY